MLMTIKRRLFISNILMIVIPVVISIIISIAGMAVAWNFYFQESRYNIENQREFNKVRDRIMNMTKNLLEGASETEQEERIAKIEDALKQNNITLSIFVSGKELYSFGGTVGQFKGKLVDAVGAIGGEGTVTIGNEEVFAENVMANDKTYTVCLFSTTEFGSDTEDNFPAAFPIVMILGTLAVVFLTNRFLTQFVFRKIEEPLDILAAGVHQIRDGNLDYQINYENNDEFAPVCEDFNVMAVRLKESVTLIQKQEQNRKELLAGISHDLRSPLTSIKAYSEGLLDGVAKAPESQKAYLQMIKTKTDEIDRMVTKLFLFSKMDMGDYPHYPEILNLEQEITSLVHATAEEYGSKGLDVKIEKLAENVEIFADPVQLRSVFSNILENSLKYKDKEQGSVSIRSKRHGNEVYIYIEDNGPGVSEDALPKLFDVFYRTDPSRNNPNKGSGLGLAITAKAIARMGGSIYAENSEAKGLFMVIKLPILKKGERNE
jgi:signal transduction histidine kinase